MTDQDPPPLPRDRIAVRWWLALLSVVLGVLFLIASKLVAYQETWLRGDQASFWSGLFVNVGTTLLLAAALIWFERVIVKKVREDRQSAVALAAEVAAESAAQKTVKAFQPQLDDLDRRISERSTSRIEEASEVAQRVADVGTFDSVRTALSEAARIGAIAKARTSMDSWSTSAWELIVPAGNSIAAPRMSVTYYRPSAASSESVMISAFGHRESSAVVWLPDRSPEDVFDNLREAMVAGGLAALGQQMSAEALFRNLSVGLRDALLSRRAAEGAWHSPEPVVEMVSDTCVMTEAGIEFKEPPLFVSSSTFGMFDPSDFEVYGQSIPARPDNVDPFLWNAVVDRGNYHYPRPDPNAVRW